MMTIACVFVNVFMFLLFGIPGTFNIRLCTTSYFPICVLRNHQFYLIASQIFVVVAKLKDVLCASPTECRDM